MTSHLSNALSQLVGGTIREYTLTGLIAAPIQLLEWSAENADPRDAELLLLSDMGESSKVYFAYLASGNTNSRLPCALKLRPVRFAPDEVNSRIQTANEIEDFSKLIKANAQVTKVFSEVPGQGTAPQSWPPLIACRHMRQVFPAISSRGNLLKVCTENKLLDQQNLPRPGATEFVILFDGDEKNPQFFLFDETDLPSDQVLDFPAWLNSLGQIPGLNPLLGKPVAEDQIEGHVRLSRYLPCLSCSERGDCYAQEKHKQRLVVMMPPAHAIIMELNRFHYDEYCDLLGGISRIAFISKYMNDAISPAHLLRISQIQDLFAEDRRYLFPADRSGVRALEIFRLRWNLFTQTCQIASQFHQICGRPHLKIDPHHVMVQMQSSGPHLPQLWQAEAHLISLGIEHLGDTDAPADIIRPSASQNPLYQADFITNSTFAQKQVCNLILRDIQPLDVEGQFILRATIEHEGIGLSRMGKKDSLKVELRSVQGLGTVEFWARVENRESNGRTMDVASLPLAISEKQLSGLKRLLNLQLRNMVFMLYPHFHVPCDIYSLGMMLFRTLLLNDENGMERIRSALDQVLREIDRNEESGESVLEDWHGFFETIIDSNDMDVLNKYHIFYHVEDRDANKPNAITDDLWREALTLGFKMITNYAKGDFSICAGHDDYDSKYPARKMEQVLEECRQIQKAIDEALFARWRWTAELRAALDMAMESSEGAKK